MRASNSSVAAAVILAAAATVTTGSPATSHDPGGFTTLIKQTKDPLVSFRIVFNVGAAADPSGLEGLASLTASMVSDAGSRSMKYEDIVQAFFPMATGMGSSVDKEMTVFMGTTHVDNLDKYYGIISGMLLDPGFRDEDFKRVKDDTLNYIKVSLRENNEEELGKEELYSEIYSGHPYGHLTAGALASIEKMTLDDVKGFYRRHYNRANLVLGMYGGFGDPFLAKVRADFQKLPEGSPTSVALPAPGAIAGRQLTIVKKETRATAISLGFPITTTRADKDWIALDVARSWLGQHRNSSAHLFQRIREIRGMNYGDYAYIEYFPRGMFLFLPEPNLVRRQQIFQIWIRPVEPDNAQFALRTALYELKKLVDNGLTQDQFDETRKFLRKNAALVAKTQSETLGYGIDAAAYGYADYVGFVRSGLDALTLADVNAAIRKHLTADNLRIVMIAKDAEELRDAIVSGKPSPIHYDAGATKPPDILDEDRIIEAFPLKLGAGSVRIVPVEEVFAR